MALPANARVQAAQSFARDLRCAHEFLHQQDGHAAEETYGLLLRQLNEAREHLRWNPAVGRPARFLQPHSAQGKALAARALALAAAQHTPHLRELVVKPYVLLYAHSKDRVVLLALKHQRQLEFRLG